jgi:hypothetical protein
MATTEQIQAWLDEAIAARHELLIGVAAVSIRKDGRAVEYTKAKLSDLNAYIDSLESQLDPTRAKRTRTFRVTQSGTGY